MKNYLLKTLAIICFLFCSAVVTAQTDPTNVTTDGTVEDAPIDNNLIYLGLAGIAFAFYYYTTHRKKQTN